MLALAYKWTIPEIDALTWPLIMRMLKRMQETPPVDLTVIGVLKSFKPKPIGQVAAGLGFPVKKGKVKRRK